MAFGVNLFLAKIITGPPTIDIQAGADEANVANTNMADEAGKAIGINRANEAIDVDEANVLEHTSE